MHCFESGLMQSARHGFCKTRIILGNLAKNAHRFLFLLFIAAWAIYQLSGDCHHYTWQDHATQVYTEWRTMVLILPVIVKIKGKPHSLFCNKRTFIGNSTTVIVKIKGKPRSLFCNKRTVIGKLMHIIIYNENKYVELMMCLLTWWI
jgi:hypothetical protein